MSEVRYVFWLNPSRISLIFLREGGGRRQDRYESYKQLAEMGKEAVKTEA